jgi:hypothetical protein
MCIGLWSAKTVECTICGIEMNNTRSNLAVCLLDDMLHDSVLALGLHWPDCISRISLNFEQVIGYASIDSNLCTSIHATRAQVIDSTTCNN